VEPYFQLPHFSELSKGNDCIICYFSIFGSLCLVAIAKQSYDILNFRFRKIGQMDYELRIAHFLLRRPSVEAPNRKHIIQTFSVRQAQ